MVFDEDKAVLRPPMMLVLIPVDLVLSGETSLALLFFLFKFPRYLVYLLVLRTLNAVDSYV